MICPKVARVQVQQVVWNEDIYPMATRQITHELWRYLAVVTDDCPAPDVDWAIEDALTRP